MNSELVKLFYFGLRVEVHTTKELMCVVSYLEKYFPHWYRERWHYENARPNPDYPCVGVGGAESANPIYRGCTTVALFPKNENCISFAEFKKRSGKRGRYKKRKGRVSVA
jgi:hypothetical protein